MVGFRVAERRACRVLGISRSSVRYRSRKDPQNALRIRLRDLAAVRVRWGYRRLHVVLQREGWQVNHKRVYRLYKQEGLELRIKRRKKKRAATPRVPCPPATAPNDRWSMDFVSDRLTGGQAFRVLTIVDNVTRVSPALEAGFSLTGRHVTAALDRAAAVYGLPKAICVDNGSEFAGKELDAWAHRRGVKLCFSRPGKPTDNAFCESFNGRLREECLDTLWFEALDEAKAALERWRREYNTERPHSALGMKAPAEFAKAWRLQPPPEPANPSS
jgi:putative transposase